MAILRLAETDPQAALRVGTMSAAGIMKNGVDVRTLANNVIAYAGQICSIVWRPRPFFHSGGGREPAGWTSGASVKVSNSCRSRTRKYDASLRA